VPEVVGEESCPPRKWSWSCSVVANDPAQEQLEETGRRAGSLEDCKEPSEESKTIRRRWKNSSDVNLQDVLNCYRYRVPSRQAWNGGPPPHRIGLSETRLRHFIAHKHMVQNSS